MRPHDDAVALSRVPFLVAIADAGSIAAAARALGTAKSAVSRQLRCLEDELGVRLIQRDRRNATLTAAGEAYLAQARRAVALAHHAADEARALAHLTTGTLRLTASPHFGAHILPEVVSTLAREDDLSVDLELSDYPVDLIAQRLDAAVFIGQPPDSSHVCVRLARVADWVCAAPGLLERVGAPATPDALASLPWVIHRRRAAALRFTGPDGVEALVQPEVRARVDDANALLALAEAGVGGASMLETLARSSVESGRLVRLFPDYELPEVTIHVVYPSREYVPRRVTRFIEVFRAALEAHSAPSS